MRQLSMHVTDLCNSKCSFCVVGSPLVRTDGVDYAGLVAFLIENQGKGFESVNFHGGEPTIHPRLFDLLDIVDELGYPEVHIQTNGRRLQDAAFTAELARRKVRLLIISLHGASPGIQDGLTQAPGGFDETIRGIENAKRAGIAVRTNTVVTRQNLRQLTDIAELCLSLGVDHVNISNLHPVGSGFFAFDTTIPSMADLQPAVLGAVETLMGSPVTVSLEGFPLCVVGPHAGLAVEDGTREIRMLYHNRVFDDYDAFMDGECREFGPPCTDCRLRSSCGGVYKEYAERRGWDEFGLADDLVANSAPAPSG